MKNVAVILSGCGVFDGAEIGEAILTLLHISKAGATYQCFAPDVTQMHTVNHLNGDDSGAPRNVLEESARIARGEVKPVTELNGDDFDALILPGGFGAAKNLCDFAVKGSEATAQQEVVSACKQFSDANKPAGYMCIAPALMPMVYGEGINLTIGHDEDTATALEAMGAKHVACDVDGIVVDEENKAVSTPAYMLAGNLVEAEKGIAKLVEKVLELA